MALEFFVEMRKIRRRLATFVEAPRSRSEQRLFQLPIIPAFGQRPSHPCRLGVFQILVNRSVSDRAATGDLPLPQSQLVSESQYFFELSHGQPFRGQCWFPPLTSGTLMPALLSSVLRPAPSRTVQGLWKSFRNDPGQGSGHRRKVTGLRSESVTGFIPESCPASFRNGARNDFGIVPGLPRNPQLGMANGRRYLRELLDGVLDLFVEHPAVGYYDDGVKDRAGILLQPDKLVTQPGDGVALAAAGGVLHEVASARSSRARIGQEPVNYPELVVAREYLLLFLPSLFVGLFHHLGVILQDVREPLPSQCLFPKVVGLQPLRIGRISGAVVESLVERQEPGILAFEFGAESHLLVVDGEMGHAASELKEQFAGITIPHVLLHGVIDGLLRQAVLQLECGDGQAINEEAQVEGELTFVLAVAELTRDAEDVGGELLGGLGVA